MKNETKKIKNQKKAQTGLNLFLSIIAMLFVIGIIIMAFALTSAQIQTLDSSYDKTGSITVSNEINFLNGSIGYYDLTYSSLYRSSCSISSIVGNSSGTKILLSSGNYSISNCRISNLTSTYSDLNWSTNYTYTYYVPNKVAEIINDSNTAISGATDWFGIFITITAVVVLILLIVLIIVSLRGAGLMSNGGNSRA